MEEQRNLVIQIRNLKKRYTLGQYDSKRATASFKRKINQLLGRTIKELPVDEIPCREFWALKGIDLDVYQGETLGIIGINGSGKSTLLKLLSRITAPTEGEIGIKGVSASMLEIGTGFNRDMTGRENVYLNGTILGMSRTEIAKKLDEIVAFSECEEFIDTPVKRYSSGMYVRLAFSVSAFLESDILMMDEVLAVGDTHFQKKCIDKMYSAAHDENRTVLFVSHNMNSIRQLCTRCIVLNAGEKIFDGDVDEAISIYTRLSNTHGRSSIQSSVRDSDKGFLLESAEIVDAEGTITRDDNAHFDVSMSALEPQSGVKILMIIRDEGSVPVGSYYSEERFSFGPGKPFSQLFSVDISTLAEGKYSVDILPCHEVDGRVMPLALFEDAIRFSRAYLGGSQRLDWNHSAWGNIRFPGMLKNI